MSADWHEANQRHLAAALAVVRAHLTREPKERASLAQLSLTQAIASMPAPSALETLATSLGLSPFERDVVLLCAGVELDAPFAAACAEAQGDARRTQPTFGLAFSVLPNAHWSALGPSGPLRRFRLVELGSNDSLTQSPLRVDEYVLHYLAGLREPDERLAAFLDPVAHDPSIVPSHRRVADRIAEAWTRAGAPELSPVIELGGQDRAAKRAIAAVASASLGLHLSTLTFGAIPATTDESLLARLLARHALLGRGALLIDCDDLESVDVLRWAALRRLVERLPCPVLVGARERLRLTGRAAIAIEVKRPTAAEQEALWRAEIASDAPDAVHALTSQFDLGAASIRSAAAAARSAENAADLGVALWDACRAEARPRLDDLAQRVESGATFDDLVLPRAQVDSLREIALHLRHRAHVYGHWGFAKSGARGLGISALFAGASGTGKTMAAEVLAGVLNLDLYRIDLSQVVSKYIGETEKNLRRVFDAAEEGAAILLFDEADALFGKRSEVKDSHDRYANIEVAYLLQRMEAYRGLSILTTNLKSSLDQAFLRRIRFVIQFPFPGPEQRAEIWRRVFPKEMPSEGLDPERLSRLNIAGGNIRNIALNAAFRAAGAGLPVRMEHVLAAAETEYAKLERTLTRAEIG